MLRYQGVEKNFPRNPSRSLDTRYTGAILVVWRRETDDERETRQWPTQSRRPTKRSATKSQTRAVERSTPEPMRRWLTRPGTESSTTATTTLAWLRSRLS